MKKLKALAVALSFAALSTASINVYAETQEQKIAEIQQLLKKHPEVVDSLHQSLTSYSAQQLGVKATLDNYNEHMISPAHSFLGQADNPELVIYNVTDYNCPFCKKLDVALEELVAEYPNVKVVNIYTPLKERTTSLDYTTASFALNVWKEAPEKFASVHEMLLKKRGKHTKASLESIAYETDTNYQLVQSNDADRLLATNYQMFMDLGLRGTPAMIMNGEIIPGYLPYDELEQVVEKQLAN
ncbi:DsbA family protein [Vibrio maerlii]|uniref:DsbA family protein n=1 Tax=Vibrio maerlii TaxID=2231648 RepID=UPI0013DFCED5|nr:DsbA family protein [Vibrio maerlii]